MQSKPWNEKRRRKKILEESNVVEFYSQGVGAWFSTALEHDKSLLTLSVAGIGVLVSMMQTSIDSVSSLLLYAGAILAFMVCIVSVLFILNRNKKHIIDVIYGEISDDLFLDRLDRAASISFFIAMLFSATLGISSAITTFSDKGNEMSNNSSKSTSQPVTAHDSVNGLGKLKPVSESFNQMKSLLKSGQGMGQLRIKTQDSQVPQQVSQAASCPAQSRTVQNKSGTTNKVR